MLICTNENNPATLKLLVASQFSGQKHELKLQNNLNDRSIREPGHLPYLEIGEVTFFISNSALWYLLPPSPGAVEAQVTEWLELEALHLAPNLCQLGSKSEKVKSNVNAVLVRLNGVLADKAYLVDNKLSAADVAIWASLYPLFKEGGISKDYKNVEKWMVNLSGNSHFKAALVEFPINGASSAYQALANGSKYLQAEISEKRPSDSNTGRISESNTSPQHQPEVVTNEELEAAAKAWSSKEVTMLHKPSGKILPKEGRKNILITSALPYVNNVPHLGNIIGCVLSADVFARFCRLCNHNTLFIGGTDEYGTATETKALEEGLSCQAICDKYYAIHKDIYDWFNISFELFGRSSSPNQTTITQDMFLQLNSNGFMFTEAVEQLHCEKCNKFLADRFVEGGCPNLGCNYEDARGDQCDGCGKLVNTIELKNPRCKICSNTPKLKTSTQFFIDLPKLEPLLLHWMKTSAPGWSNNAQVIAKTWLRDGLKPRCITRDLKWGVPVPLHDYRDKVFYVWFDAPIGYMSITKTYTEEWEKWWRPPPKTDITLYQFMAKDNVPFHSVMFPASLLGCNRGYITVSHIMATEYLNYEDGKFSKSRGVGVFGNDARDTGIPSDVWRFYLLYLRPESQDSSFSWADLVTKNNSELLNNLGNFINRALVFAKNNFNGTVPEIKPTKDDLSFLVLCTRELKGYVACLEKAKLRDGIRHILTISRHGNQYMQSNQPWVLLKGTPEEKARAGTVIGVCCNVACLLAMLIEPYLPETSSKLKKQLNAKDTALNPERVEINQLLPTGHKLGEPSPLFDKLDPTRVEELKSKFAGQQNGNGKTAAPTAPLQNGVALNGDVTSLEAEVAKQADKVRALKSSGVDKKVWQPEVAALLDLKKKLEAAQKAPPAEQAARTAAVDPENVKLLEEAVSKQGLVVRKLKEGGADKSVWQPEVAVLLDLKKKLEAAQKAPPAQQAAKAVAVDPEDVKFLEEAVSKQGLVVRKLKEGGADKSVWQPEVNKLLALKAKHAALAGTPPPAAPAGKKGKKK